MITIDVSEIGPWTSPQDRDPSLKIKVVMEMLIK